MRTWMLRLCTLLAIDAVSAAAQAQPYVFEEMAREFTDGLGWLEPDLPPALAPDGRVAFGGYEPSASPPSSPRLFVSNGAALTPIDLTSAGYEMPKALQVDGAGRVVFLTARATGSGTMRGLYSVSAGGGAFSTHFEDALLPAYWKYFGLSPNGTLAFSTIKDGSGAIQRGVLPAAPSSLRNGSGVFFNTRGVDVNDLGQVAVEMEYTDPTKGLSRGILVFSEPNQALMQIDTAIEKAGVGFSPQFAMNAYGQVAFAVNSTSTLRFYDPPNDASGTLIATMTVEPGVYRAEPTPFGEPSSLTTVALASGAYDTFGRVSINAAGVVAFEASLDEPYKFGIYRGPDAVLHKIVQQGDVIGGALFSWLRMGELNDAGQLTFLSSDYHSTDRQVWRVSGIHAPIFIRIERWLLRWLELLWP